MLPTNKVIQIIKEMMTGNPSGGGGGFGSTPSKSGVDGFDPLMGFRRRQSGTIDYRKVSKQYKTWVRKLDNK
jgi:hypothetical protein